MTVIDTKMTIFSEKEIDGHSGATVMLMTSLCWWLTMPNNMPECDVGDRFVILDMKCILVTLNVVYKFASKIILM